MLGVRFRRAPVETAQRARRVVEAPRARRSAGIEAAIDVGEGGCTRSTRSSQIEIGQQAKLPHRGQVLAAPPSKTVLHSASTHSTADFRCTPNGD
jgi:hypothetical protein